MKLSQLITVLKDAKKMCGDHYIWEMNIDFPLPLNMEMELHPKVSRSEGVISGGNRAEKINLRADFDYEDGVKLKHTDLTRE